MRAARTTATYKTQPHKNVASTSSCMYQRGRASHYWPGSLARSVRHNTILLAYGNKQRHFSHRPPKVPWPQLLSGLRRYKPPRRTNTPPTTRLPRGEYARVRGHELGQYTRQRKRHASSKKILRPLGVDADEPGQLGSQGASRRWPELQGSITCVTTDAAAEMTT